MTYFDTTASYGTERQRSAALPSFLLILALFAAAVDFRRIDSDTGMAIVIVALIGFFANLALTMNIGKIRKGVFFAALPFVWLASVSIISGSLRGNPVTEVLAHVLPLMIFIFAFISAAEFATSDRLLDRQIKLVVVFAIFAAIWKLTLAFVYYGLDLNSVRYQALSGATPLLFAFGITSFFIQKRSFAAIALALALGVVFVSVTRTYIVAFAFSALPFLILLWMKDIRKLVLRAGIALFLLSVMMTFLTIFIPELAERWLGRLSVANTVGFDITAVTRISQMVDQLGQLTASLSGLLFGFGPSAPSGFAGESGQLLRSYLGQSADIWVNLGYGHNQFVGLFFVGGILAGLPAFWALMSFLRLALFHGGTDFASPTRRFSFFCGASAFTGYMGYALFAAPFGDRGLSFFMATSLGLMFAGLYAPPKGATAPPVLPRRSSKQSV